MVHRSDVGAFVWPVEGKFKRGVLKPQRVGFRPLEFNGKHDSNHLFMRIELLELSTVLIRMNQPALLFGG